MNKVTKPIKQKTPKSALERINQIEDTLPALINAVNQGFVQAEQRIMSLTEVLGAVVEKLGAAEVDNIIQSQRNAREAAKAEEARLWVEKELQEGRLEKLAAVEDGALVVGVEYDTNGKPVGAGRTQLTMDRIRPEVRDMLLGQPVGTKIDTGEGSFEVTAAYRLQNTTATANG